jgi:toxin ParE1/3/4
MVKYKLSNVAKEDLIRIHHYGVKQFGIKQADQYAFLPHCKTHNKN